MKKYSEYINVFLFGVILYLLSAMFVLVSGYQYSFITGVFVAQDRYASFFDDLLMAVFWLILDIIYVEQKRYMKKKSSHKNENK